MDYTSIRDLKETDISLVLGLVFTEIANRIGIKEAIEDANKADIKEMLLMRFKNLSIEELSYAFKLERFGLLGERTDHYQLFNSEYVSKVLDKYKKWLSKMRHDNNLPISKETKEPELSDEEKEMIFLHGLITCFDAYQQKGFFDPEQIIIHYHDHLHELNLFYFTDEEKKEMWIQAKEKVQTGLLEITDRDQYKNALQKIKNGDRTLREITYKKLRLAKLFDKIIAKQQHIKDLL